MVSRGAWIAACITGMLVFGGLAVLTAYVIFYDPETGVAQFTTRGIAWPIFFILAAGASAAGIFMSPREFRETMLPPEPKRAAWLDDLAKPPPGKDRADD